MKFFVGIEFDQQVVKELIRITEYLEKHDNMGKFEPDENYHLTLSYLDELSDAGSVINRLKQISHKSFQLQLNKLGTFENNDQNVLWIDVDNELDALHALQEKVFQTIEHLCGLFQTLTYTPHITLAYGNDSLQEIEEILAACKIQKITFSVTSFHLYEIKSSFAGTRFKKTATFLLDNGSGEKTQ